MERESRDLQLIISCNLGQSQSSQLYQSITTTPTHKSNKELKKSIRLVDKEVGYSYRQASSRLEEPQQSCCFCWYRKAPIIPEEHYWRYEFIARIKDIKIDWAVAIS